MYSIPYLLVKKPGFPSNTIQPGAGAQSEVVSAPRVNISTPILSPSPVPTPSVMPPVPPRLKAMPSGAAKRSHETSFGTSAPHTEAPGLVVRQDGTEVWGTAKRRRVDHDGPAVNVSTAGETPLGPRAAVLPAASPTAERSRLDDLVEACMSPDAATARKHLEMFFQYPFKSGKDLENYVQSLKVLTEHATHRSPTLADWTADVTCYQGLHRLRLECIKTKSYDHEIDAEREALKRQVKALLFAKGTPPVFIELAYRARHSTPAELSTSYPLSIGHWALRYMGLLNQVDSSMKSLHPDDPAIVVREQAKPAKKGAAHTSTALDTVPRLLPATMQGVTIPAYRAAPAAVGAPVAASGPNDLGATGDANRIAVSEGNSSGAAKKRRRTMMAVGPESIPPFTGQPQARREATDLVIAKLHERESISGLEMDPALREGTITSDELHARI